jgi:Circularly permutated YpsA SLOG family
MALKGAEAGDMLMIRKIISGGQTGADRAGLDFAIEAGLEHGGYIPSGILSRKPIVPVLKACQRSPKNSKQKFSGRPNARRLSSNSPAAIKFWPRLLPVLGFG